MREGCDAKGGFPGGWRRWDDFRQCLANERRNVSFGTELRNEREERGIGLEDVAAVTHVCERHLRALEAGDYGELPGGVFNRGIVRSYCRHLGLDEAEWLERFAAVPGGQVEELDWAVFAKQMQRNRGRKGPGQQPLWAVVLMMLTLATLTWGAWHFHQGTDSSRGGARAAAVGIDSGASTAQ
jgi:cytoskeleton protein RodZ